MKKSDFAKYWRAFLRWKGWSVTASVCVKAWQAAVSWRGWNKIFCLPLLPVLILSIACAMGLVWVFAHGMEMQFPAYFLYGLSAWCLTALCVKLPTGLRGAGAWVSRHPKLTALMKNKELHFKLGLYVEQFINFAYGIFKIVSGVVIGSAWIGCDGIYNMAQALIHRGPDEQSYHYFPQGAFNQNFLLAGYIPGTFPRAMQPVTRT